VSEITQEVLNYEPIYEMIRKSSLSPWLDTLPNQVENYLNGTRWGDLPKWIRAVQNLPDINPSSIDMSDAVIRIGQKEDVNEDEKKCIEYNLKALQPWRKGPFDTFGVYIDTEWRSDLKWDRLKDHVTSLKDRMILDIGCGSGYHCWRMAAEGAKLVVGIDPTLLYVVQFYAMQKYIQMDHVSVLPLSVDDLPKDCNGFDTVFSMGLLYHRRSPLDHLLQCQSMLRSGGELVLETLVIDGGKGEVLNPETRYAKMPNVWLIPSCATLETWLKKIGFINIRCVSVNKTTSEEQRSTDWVGFESLKDFLDPGDDQLTIEGYPAPKRAVFVANHL